MNKKAYMNNIKVLREAKDHMIMDRISKLEAVLRLEKQINNVIYDTMFKLMGGAMANELMQPVYMMTENFIWGGKHE